MAAQRGLKTVCVRRGSRAPRRRRGSGSWRGSFLEETYGQDVLKCTRALLEPEMGFFLPTAAMVGCGVRAPPDEPLTAKSFFPSFTPPPLNYDPVRSQALRFLFACAWATWFLACLPARCPSCLELLTPLLRPPISSTDSDLTDGRPLDLALAPALLRTTVTSTATECVPSLPSSRASH